MTEPARRFPPPWTATRPTPASSSAPTNGQALAYVYFEVVRAEISGASLFSRDEARRIAANIAKLPELRPQDGAFVWPLGVFSVSLGTSTTVGKARFDFARTTTNTAAASAISTAFITGTEWNTGDGFFASASDKMFFVAFAHLSTYLAPPSTAAVAVVAVPHKLIDPARTRKNCRKKGVIDCHRSWRPRQ